VLRVWWFYRNWWIWRKMTSFMERGMSNILSWWKSVHFYKSWLLRYRKSWESSTYNISTYKGRGRRGELFVCVCTVTFHFHPFILPLTQLTGINGFWSTFIQKSPSLIVFCCTLLFNYDFDFIPFLVGNSMKDDSSDLTCTFTVVRCPDFMVVTPLFTYLSIAFSNQKFSSCSPTMGVGFVKLRSDSFCGDRVFKMNIQFCCPVTCAAIVVRFFFKQSFSVYDNLFLSVLILARCSSSLMSSHDSYMQA
jgi:hypothetical protein